jgi:GNAT superfamily N-acetyltransferase
MEVNVRTVTGRADMRRFVELPYRLYRGDANWVPQLRMDDFKKLDPRRHPFWQHARRECYLAERDGHPVGRIVVLEDDLWFETHAEHAATWGWFECENDPRAAAALFDAAKAWARGRGCTRLIGPMSPNANDLVGTQIRGFDGPPVILMSYNPPYHDELIRACGNTKWVDLIAWLLASNDVPARLERIMPTVQKRGKFTIRKLNMKKLEAEVRIARDVFNEFEKVNKIYTPMTEPEFQQLVRDIRIAIDPDIVFFAEVDGKVVGASMALPDFNVPFRAAYGRLFPFGVFKLLLARRKIAQARVVSLGILEGYRSRGIDLAFFYHSFKEAVPKGYNGGEMSWVEEDNVPMTNAAIKLGGKPYRAYRIYEQKL